MPPRSSLTSSFSITDSNNEVVCPLRNQDGSSCRKRCIGVGLPLFVLLLFSPAPCCRALFPQYAYLVPRSYSYLHRGELNQIRQDIYLSLYLQSTEHGQHILPRIPFYSIQQLRQLTDALRTDTSHVYRRRDIVPCRNISVEHTPSITYLSFPRLRKASFS